MNTNQQHLWAEKPLTRDDVRKMINEHGGPNGLDLSNRNLKGIDLSKTDLSGIILTGSILCNANLQLTNLQESANLQETDLSCANLEMSIILYANLKRADLSKAVLKGANFYGAQLQDANLWAADLTYTALDGADLEGATFRGAIFDHTYLYGANLANANLYGADLSTVSSLNGIKWGKKYIIGEELKCSPETAEGVYRDLKRWHTQAGLYDIAGEFFFREMEMKRKARKWRPNPFPKLWTTLTYLLCGYGERPARAIVSALVIVLGLGSIYIAGTSSIDLAYYFSLVSFTAIGYGGWVDSASVVSWVKALGAVEAVLGVFMMALFVTTFTRKMSR
jgi:hypothetical protein